MTRREVHPFLPLLLPGLALFCLVLHLAVPGCVGWCWLRGGRRPSLSSSSSTSCVVCWYRRCRRNVPNWENSRAPTKKKSLISAAPLSVQSRWQSPKGRDSYPISVSFPWGWLLLGRSQRWPKMAVLLSDGGRRKGECGRKLLLRNSLIQSFQFLQLQFRRPLLGCC